MRRDHAVPVVEGPVQVGGAFSVAVQDEHIAKRVSGRDAVVSEELKPVQSMRIARARRDASHALAPGRAH